ncbi:MAG: PKD domain-containing protein [Bacteroidia bacterium]|nr:PKD domain-containing protein [Bacteroidia bacterium]
MKNIILLFALAFILLVPGKSAASGGPDAYGYTWITSLDAGGPTFNWIDITSRAGVQTVTGLADDNSAAGMINVGFPFHYYWSDYSQLKVGSNGWLSFNNVSNIASCFPTIPTAGGAGDNILAPLMSDLNFTGAGNVGNVKYWTNGVDSFIISYINVPYWSVSAPGWTGSNSFQVILCGNDSSITYQYGGISAPILNAGCVDMTVGIENSTGGIGLQVHSDATVPSNYVIHFDYPAVVLLSIRDILPEWNTNNENAAEIVVQNMPHALQSNIHNGGNTSVTTTINLQENIRNSVLASVHSSAGLLPTLAAGDDTLFTFTPWTASPTGLYSFEVTTSNSQDINAANDINTTEIQVIDVCSPSAVLGYVTGNAPGGSVNWNGGANDDGVSVYFVPPVYPYEVSSLSFYISSNVGNYFIANIYDDDGPNGSPGTLLYTTTVAAGSVVAGAWNNVAVSPGVTLNGGGFYAAWIQGGTSIFLGCETTAPYSHRNYEVLDGSWAKFRFNNTQDACIRATITNYSTTPVAAYSSAYSGPLTYNFTDASTGFITSWQWDFGDGNTSTQQFPTHTYAASGTYNVCLITTTLCGTADTICQSLSACAPATISSDPLVSIICAEGTTTMIVGANGTGLTYQWQENQGSGFNNIIPAAPYAGETTATLTINGATAAMNGYTYQCVVSGTCGNATSNSALLTINALPTVTLSALTDVCEDEPGFTITGESPAGGTFSGAGVFSGSFNAATAGTGTHPITYIYTDANSCSDTATTNITVNALPVVTQSSYADVCGNATAFALTNGTPVGGTYSGTGVSAGNFDASVAGAGTQTITYDYTDANSCTASATSSINVNAAPVVTLSSLGTVCINDAAFALTGESPAGGIFSGTGVSAGNFDPAVAGAGTVTITYTYTDANSCSDTAQQNIVVDLCLGIAQTQTRRTCLDATGD